MNKVSETQSLARAAAATFGLAMFYGGLTALAVWLASGKRPFLWGSVVLGVTIALAAVCLAAIWDLFEPEKGKYSFKPISFFGLAKVLIGLFLCFVLTAPLMILTAGQLGRWLESIPEKNQFEEEQAEN